MPTFFITTNQQTPKREREGEGESFSINNTLKTETIVDTRAPLFFGCLGSIGMRRGRMFMGENLLNFSSDLVGNFVFYI